MDEKTKEILRKQLELLSKVSQDASIEDMAKITHAMIEVASFLVGTCC